MQPKRAPRHWQRQTPMQMLLQLRRSQASDLKHSFTHLQAPQDRRHAAVPKQQPILRVHRPASAQYNNHHTHHIYRPLSSVAPFKRLLSMHRYSWCMWDPREAAGPTAWQQQHQAAKTRNAPNIPVNCPHLTALCAITPHCSSRHVNVQQPQPSSRGPGQYTKLP